MCASYCLSALHVLIYLIFQQYKMRKQNFYWPIDDSEVVTCPNSPAEKWQTWLCLPERDNLLLICSRYSCCLWLCFCPCFLFSQDHLKCVPCHTNYLSLIVLLSYFQWNCSVALGQGHHLASTTYSITAWWRRRYLGSILSNCRKNRCSCMHPTSQFCCDKRCLDFTISSHMVPHYIVHRTSSIPDISHPSCNDDYQPPNTLIPLGKFLTHLGFVLFITSLCLSCLN